MPIRRSPCERSSWSSRIASSAVNSGAEATRIPASPEEISSSAAEIRTNGTATWIAPSRNSQGTPRPRAGAQRAGADGERDEDQRRERDPRPGDHPRRHVADADLDEEVARPPDRAEDDEQGPGATIHAVEVRRAPLCRPITSADRADKEVAITGRRLPIQMYDVLYLDHSGRLDAHREHARA